MVVDIGTVAEGIEGAKGACHAARGADDIAPGVVSVLYHRCTGAVHDSNDITLDVADIVVVGIVPAGGNRYAFGIVDEINPVIAHRHIAQPVAHICIVVGSAAVGAFRPQAISVVCEVPCAVTWRWSLRPHRSASSPGHIPFLPRSSNEGLGEVPCTVTQRIADFIAAIGLTVIAYKRCPLIE